MITLIQLSDCHLLKDKDKAAYSGIAPYHSLENVLQSVVADIARGFKSVEHKHIEEAPSGKAEDEVSGEAITNTTLLVTGDISGDHSPESYQHFLDLMDEYIAPLNLSWFVLAGNHDNNPYFEKALGHRHLKRDKSLQFEHWHIHGMDTRVDGNTHTSGGEVSESDVQALEHALKASSTVNHVIALHHHVLPSNSWMDKHFLANAKRVVSLSERYPQVKALIHGHVHSPLRQHIGQGATPSFGSPSTCWQWEMQQEFGVSHELPGYQVISLFDDGGITVSIERVALAP
ncbi:metallophosphoesterase [Alteromonas gracilis]|uniref:metallophosphoesterase n=1 Tax=Alteromonas gracilis TaxID=1479524 RepID=UPI0037350991